MKTDVTVTAAMDARAKQPCPFTFRELSNIACHAGGVWRDADKYIQRRRRKGEILLTRVGFDHLWSEVSK